MVLSEFLGKAYARILQLAKLITDAERERSNSLALKNEYDLLMLVVFALGENKRGYTNGFTADELQAAISYTVARTNLYSLESIGLRRSFVMPAVIARLMADQVGATWNGEAVSVQYVLDQLVNSGGGEGGVSNHDLLTGKDVLQIDTAVDPEDTTKEWHLSSKVASDVKNLVYPSTDPTVSINVTPAAQLEYNATNNVFQIDATGTKTSTLATIKELKIEVSRDAGVTWATIRNSVNLSGNSYTITDEPYSGNVGVLNNASYVFRATAKDSLGKTKTATQTVSFKAYVAPTVTVAVNPNTTQLFGHEDFLLSGTVTRNSPNMAITSLVLEKKEDGAAWEEVTASAPGNAGGSITDFAFSVTQGTAVLKVRANGKDAAGDHFSAETTVNFQHHLHYGFNAKPSLEDPDPELNMTEEDILGLDGRILSGTWLRNIVLAANATLRYVWIVFASDTWPTKITDITNGNTDYTISDEGGAGDYFRMGSVAGNNEEGFATTWYLLRSRNATSGYGNTNIELK